MQTMENAHSFILKNRGKANEWSIRIDAREK
jgi:hypothetical protein